MKRLLIHLACLLALITVPIRADEEADRLEIVSRARAMIDAIFKDDMNLAVGFMHPETVQRIGGEEALKKAIGGLADQMKRIGLEFVSMDIRPPAEFFTRGQRTFTVVKTATVMKIPSKVRITEESSMIALRDTPGGQWTFVRVSAQVAGDRDLLKTLLPDFPDELALEPPTKPVTEPVGK